MGPYLRAAVREAVRDPRTWAWGALGALLLWVGVSLDILAIEASGERISRLGWGTLEFVTMLACLARASRLGGGAADGDLEDPLRATALGPLGLSAAQMGSAVVRGLVVSVPTFALLLVQYTHAPGSGAASLGAPAALWFVSLLAAGAFGLALARVFGPAAGFLLAVGTLVALRAGLLPDVAAGLLPPAASIEWNAARLAAALLATVGWLAGAATLRPR